MALQSSLKTIKLGAPNARDYNSREDFLVARDAHDAICQNVKSAANSFRDYAVSIQKGGR